MIDFLLTSLDSAVDFAPVWLRITFWGVFLGVATMLVYGWLSPQEELTALKEKLDDANARLRDYDGDDPSVLWSMTKNSLGLSMQQLRLRLVSTMAAGVPIILILIWMEGAYSYRLPEPGEVVDVTVASASVEADELTWEPGTLVEESSGKKAKLVWPPAEDEEEVRLRAATTDEPLLTLPFEHARPVLSTKNWTHYLYGNPNGYLPPKSPVDRIVVELPLREVLPFGPTWLRTWHIFFLVVLTVAALAAKVGFDIE